MNAFSKSKLAMFLTSLGIIIIGLQGLLATSPFPPSTNEVVSSLLAFTALAIVPWKQYLSPDVSNGGAQVTLIAAILITLGGVLGLLNVFHLSEETAKYWKWGITVLSTILSYYSKTIFPSFARKQTVLQLKAQ